MPPPPFFKSNKIDVIHLCCCHFKDISTFLEVIQGQGAELAIIFYFEKIVLNLRLDGSCI